MDPQPRADQHRSSEQHSDTCSDDRHFRCASWNTDPAFEVQVPARPQRNVRQNFGLPPSAAGGRP